MSKPPSTSLCIFRALALAVSTVTLLFASTVRAQGNDMSSPTGGRSTLMGNTGVALGRDGSSPFMNPAGIVRIEDRRLAFSVNFYTFGLTNYSSFHVPSVVDTTQFAAPKNQVFITNNVSVLPSTLCLFFTLGDLQKIADPKAAPIPADRVMRRKLAICLAQLESEDVGLEAVHFESTSASGPISQVASLSRRWSRTYVGLTYSSYLTDRVAIGASLNGIYTHSRFGYDSSSILGKLGGGDVASSISMSGSAHALDLTAIAGVTYHASDVTTLGLSVRPPSLHVLGGYDGTFAQSSSGNGADDSTVTNASGSFFAPTPLRVAAGIGFEWEKVKLEADTALVLPIANAMSTNVDATTSHLSAAGYEQTTSKASFIVADHPVVNPALGMEYFVRRSFSFLGGVSASFSTLDTLTPQPTVGNLVQAKENDLAAAFGLGSYGEGKELLVGTQFQFGWGSTLVADPYVVPNQWATVNMQSYALMFVVSGATDLRSIERAVEKVKNAVETGDPNKAAPRTPDKTPTVTTATPTPEKAAPERTAPKEPEGSGKDPTQAVP
ncbi:MAG: hypothetical protein ABI551_15235 [Polyangiaceae bacterium]